MTLFHILPVCAKGLVNIYYGQTKKSTYVKIDNPNCFLKVQHDKMQIDMEVELISFGKKERKRNTGALWVWSEIKTGALWA